MKWARAVHHLQTLADACAAQQTFVGALPVTQLWAVGDILSEPTDLEWVRVAICVDLPVSEVAWWSEPRGSEHWANATRMSKNPISRWWRSAHAPVWNHRIVRPALLWDATDGVRPETLAALADGRGEQVRTAAPTEAELRARMLDELAVSRRSLEACTQTYDDKRWSPGRLEPYADALWRAADGYLDIRAYLDGVAT